MYITTVDNIGIKQESRSNISHRTGFIVIALLASLWLAKDVKANTVNPPVNSTPSSVSTLNLKNDCAKDWKRGEKNDLNGKICFGGMGSIDQPYVSELGFYGQLMLNINNLEYPIDFDRKDQEVNSNNSITVSCKGAKEPEFCSYTLKSTTFSPPSVIRSEQNVAPDLIRNCSDSVDMYNPVTNTVPSCENFFTGYEPDRVTYILNELSNGTYEISATKKLNNGDVSEVSYPAEKKLGGYFWTISNPNGTDIYYFTKDNIIKKWDVEDKTGFLQANWWKILAGFLTIVGIRTLFLNLGEKISNLPIKKKHK